MRKRFFSISRHETSNCAAERPVLQRFPAFATSDQYVRSLSVTIRSFRTESRALITFRTTDEDALSVPLVKPTFPRAGDDEHESAERYFSILASLVPEGRLIAELLKEIKVFVSLRFPFEPSSSSEAC